MAVHHGVEFENPIGTPVLAVGDGTIVIAGSDDRQVYGARTGFYGQVVILQLAQKLDGIALYVVYGHLSEIYVREGQSVRVGDALGAVGMTGSALGPHLHLEVRYGLNDYRAAVNPELWLRLSDGYGALAGSLLTATDEPVADVTITLFRASAPSRPVRYLSTLPAPGGLQRSGLGRELCCRRSGRWGVDRAGLPERPERAIRRHHPTWGDHIPDPAFLEEKQDAHDRDQAAGRADHRA